MFTLAIIKTWDPIYFQQCGWYLDCPFKKPHSFDIALKDSIQPLIPSPATSVPGSESPTYPMRCSSRSKTATKGGKPRGSKRKAAELVEEPMDEDICANGSDIGVLPAELLDPISSHLPREPAPKPIRFVPPAMKAMSSSHACTSSSASPWVLILNDSINMMLDYKAKHNKFPSTYDDMVVYLSDVNIQLNIFPFNSVSMLLFPNSISTERSGFLKKMLEHLGNFSSHVSYCRRL